MIGKLKEKVRSLEEERGMVGIGTLIVFIAMVIVAAVAAGVLINTSGALQQQARATGEETIQEVASGVKVLAAKGQTDENGDISSVDLIIRPYAGTQGINLENTVIQYKSDFEVEHLTYDNTGPVSGTSFGISNIQDTSGTGATMLEEMGDIVKVSLSLTTALGPSQEASVSIMPNSGFQSYYGIIVPATTKTSTWYEL